MVVLGFYLRAGMFRTWPEITAYTARQYNQVGLYARGTTLRCSKTPQE